MVPLHLSYADYLVKSSKKLNKMPLSCTHPDCSYATEAVAENVADMLELLKIHAMTCHTTMTSVGTPTHQAQAERVKRPILSLSDKLLDPEDYEHFVYSFKQFKARLGDKPCKSSGQKFNFQNCLKST